MDNSGFRAFAEQRAEEKRQKQANAAAPPSEEDRARKKAKQQASYDRRMAIQKRREEALAETSRYTDRAAERRTRTPRVRALPNSHSYIRKLQGHSRRRCWHVAARPMSW